MRAWNLEHCKSLNVPQRNASLYSSATIMLTYFFNNLNISRLLASLPDTFYSKYIWLIRRNQGWTSPFSLQCVN